LGAVLASYSTAGASLRVRGHMASSGDVTIAIPFHAIGSEARHQADALESQLRTIDPGCYPVRRNPAALCRALLDTGVDSQLLEAMQLVKAGCEAALEERDRWSGLHDEGQRRDRWVTPAIIDRIHAAVARSQGVAPWEADGALPGVLQPHLRACFDSMELYLDIDLPQPWAPADKAWRVANAVVDGEWDGEAPHALRPTGADDARLMSTEELYMQTVETAVRR